MKLNIDHNIPMPEKTAGKPSKFEALLHMEVGDSVLVDTYRDACTLQMLLSRHDMQASMRKQEGQYRVWRIR